MKKTTREQLDMLSEVRTMVQHARTEISNARKEIADAKKEAMGSRRDVSEVAKDAFETRKLNESWRSVLSDMGNNLTQVAKDVATMHQDEKLERYTLATTMSKLRNELAQVSVSLAMMAKAVAPSLRDIKASSPGLTGKAATVVDDLLKKAELSGTEKDG